MVRLESIQGEPLVRIVRDVSPIKCQSNKQVNRLLDGTYHVQIIGEPAKSIDAKRPKTAAEVEIRLSQRLQKTDAGNLKTFYFSATLILKGPLPTPSKGPGITLPRGRRLPKKSLSIHRGVPSGFS